MSLRSKIKMAKSVIKGLSETDVDPDPVVQFSRWFADAQGSGMSLPEAVAVASADKTGKPSVRMMLLKGHDERGFVFYTNYKSRKAGELDRNPQCALLFHWWPLERQVRIEGTVERATQEESEAYFKSRPHGSQIGAWASPQSAVIDGREELELKVKATEGEFKGSDIPLPPFWGGYRLVPTSVEFWQGRVNRLHDRIVYRRVGETWEVSRLAP